MSHYMTALAMKQTGLKPASKIVLYWLADHHNAKTGYCFPSLKTLAKECEMDKSTVIRHLGVLEDAGLIERVQRKRENGSLSSNIYRLNLSVVAESNNGCCKTQPPDVANRNTHNLGKNNLGNEQDTAHFGNGPGQDDANGEQATQCDPSLNQSSLKVCNELGPDKAVLIEEFENIWKKYPRKVGKGRAEKLWANIRRVTPLEQITGPLDQFIEVKAGEPVDKIPHLTTWLSEKRWLDDQTHARNRPETTSDRLNRICLNTKEIRGDPVSGPARKPPKIELRLDR